MNIEEIFNEKSILVTGGTGSFGRKFCQMVLAKAKPKRFVVFSRDEYKQFEMAKEFEGSPLRYFLGDVRDRNRLYRALDGIDIVIHAAALKQIPAAEYNPFEFIQTNVIGAQNVIDASIDRGVEKVVALSTDKAANPINLYGATKLCADKLFISGNSYASHGRTRFSVVRYGNVMGSRGSVIPLFQEMKEKGVISITDERMTRFWITLEQGVELVFRALREMSGGEIFVPKIPSMKVIDLAEVIAPECERQIVGIRPGEKLHEVMISKDDSFRAIEFKEYFIIKPSYPWWGRKAWTGGQPMEPYTEYASDNNSMWLTKKDLIRMLEGVSQGSSFTSI